MPNVWNSCYWPVYCRLLDQRWQLAKELNYCHLIRKTWSQRAWLIVCLLGWWSYDISGYCHFQWKQVVSLRSTKEYWNCRGESREWDDWVRESRSVSSVVQRHWKKERSVNLTVTRGWGCRQFLQVNALKAKWTGTNKNDYPPPRERATPGCTHQLAGSV